jgi:hypothetical protein
LPDVTTVARVVSSELHEPIDGKLDNHFATQADDGVLWFDGTAATISKAAR